MGAFKALSLGLHQVRLGMFWKRMRLYTSCLALAAMAILFALAIFVPEHCTPASTSHNQLPNCPASLTKCLVIWVVCSMGHCLPGL